jgi:glutamyl-Q tRNA(Asp) synthetase
LTGRAQEERMASGAPYALRLDSKKASARVGSLSFEEQGRGPNGERGRIDVDPLLFGDVVLARKDVPASYHLCVVVDDAEQGVTLVTRGFDLFHAAHVQRTLQSLLGFAEPAYAHHRLILDEAGHKLSKRTPGSTLRSLCENGTSPEAIRANFPGLI